MRFALLALLLGGCVGPMAFQTMSPEQIREIIKDKDAFISCGIAMYAGATITLVTMNTNKGIPIVGKIGKNCEMDFDSDPYVKP